MAGIINRTFFFEQLRGVLFGKAISQKQVDGLTTLLDYWEAKLATSDDRWLAYALATTYHETAFTMQPIKEYGPRAYFIAMYDPPPAGKHPKIAAQLGNTRPGDGPLFCGKGYVQLTGRRNYKDWTVRLAKPGVNLETTPDKVMEPAIAIVILFEGMIKGTFTGKKLSQYFSPTKADWEGARAIINGTDKKGPIAHYAQKFYAAISYTV
jgi:putative chitinase